MQFTLGLAVPFTSLCPCSKEISRYGAHNQRGLMKAENPGQETRLYLDWRFGGADGGAGKQWGLFVVKREDEKYVTEKAYENLNERRRYFAGFGSRFT